MVRDKPKYNLLTKKLLAEGCTKDDHPNYVSWSKWDGGFVYKSDYLSELIFSTPCGLLVKGSYFIHGYMAWKSIQWRPENNNPVVPCPMYNKKEKCLMNNELLQNLTIHCGKEQIAQCACYLVDEPYDYKRSLDKVNDDIWTEANELFKEFNVRKCGRACKEQCSYDRCAKQWSIGYNPILCAENNMPCEYCNVLQLYLQKSKSNVFYDRIETKTKKDNNGKLTNDTETQITKGLRLLDHQVSHTICEAIVKYGKWRVIDTEKDNTENQRLFDPNYSSKLVNFRAEARETRDLTEDMQQIHDGIKIVHESDVAKQKKVAKKKRKEARQRAKNAQE